MLTKLLIKKITATMLGFNKNKPETTTKWAMFHQSKKVIGNKVQRDC